MMQAVAGWKGRKLGFTLLVASAVTMSGCCILTDSLTRRLDSSAPNSFDSVATAQFTRFHNHVSICRLSNISVHVIIANRNSFAVRDYSDPQLQTPMILSHYFVGGYNRSAHREFNLYSFDPIIIDPPENFRVTMYYDNQPIQITLPPRVLIPSSSQTSQTATITLSTSIPALTFEFPMIVKNCPASRVNGGNENGRY